MPLEIDQLVHTKGHGRLIVIVVQPKIFLDTHCLENAKDWREGFATGLLKSCLITPLMSWYDGDKGSVGSLMQLRPDSDYIDNVLL